MIKRKSLLFFTLVIAIVALFGVTEVMAFCDYCNPDPPDLPISVTEGGYTITLTGITEEASCTKNDPATYGQTDLGTAIPCYRWDFAVHNEGNPSALTGLNFLALFIPDCCTDPYIYFDLSAGTPDNAKIYPVAAGEPTVKIGRFNESAYMFKTTPDTPTLWSIVTTTDVITSLPAVLATGRKDNATSFEMPGPGCTAPESLAVGGSTYTECVNWYGDPADARDDVSFEIVRQGNRDGCINSVTFYAGLSCDPANPYFAATREDLPTDYVASGALHPGSCADEGVSVTHSSPYYWYSVVSGGYTFQGCLYLVNGTWVNKSLCGH